jgi:hypothetical protein
MKNLQRGKLSTSSMDISKLVVRLCIAVSGENYILKSFIICSDVMKSRGVRWVGIVICMGQKFQIRQSWCLRKYQVLKKEAAAYS